MISKQAEAIKQEMMQAVIRRRELLMLEDAVGETAASGFVVARTINAERMQLRRTLAEAQLRNWARITAAPLSPLQRRLLGLRYVLGCTWGDVVLRVDKAKQYLLREHNKALELLALTAVSEAKK